MTGRGPAIRLGAGLAAAALVALAGCLFQGDRPETGGNGSGVRGRFVDASGNPLPGVRVSALPAHDFRLAKLSAAARGIADSAVTDGSGRYALPGLASGEYNLVGEYGEGELAVLVPEVKYLASEGLLELGQDTLLAPGSIRGRVLRGGSGQEGVLAYLPGTSYLAVSDSSGTFLVTGIPAGRYRVNYLVPGFQAKTDTGVEVRAGMTARLPDKVLAYDISLPPPAPSMPRAVFDSLLGVVRLEWDRVPVEDLLGYLVYRDTGGASAPLLLTPRIHPETTFVDTLTEALWAGRIAARVTYRIRSVDLAKNPSLNYSPPLVVTASRTWPTDLTMEIFGLNDLGQAWRRDTLDMVIGFRNAMMPIREIAWKAEGNPPREERVAVSGREGSISRRISWSGNGTYRLSAEAVDSVGDTTRMERTLTVMEGMPFAYAGEDTVVSPGDSVHLRGQGWDVSGITVGREWDIGATGTFLATPDGIHRFVAPAGEGQVRCVYRVTDDEGWQASDTLILEVIPDPPAARVTGPLQAFQGDTVRLSGAASSDLFGRVVAWEWDIGARGVFAASSGPDTAFVAEGPGANLDCVLRVTDDDGRTSTAVYRVGLSARDQWIQLMADAPFSVLESFKSWEWNGMLWVEGPLRNSPNRERGLWRSPDMFTWTRVEPDSADADWLGLEYVAAMGGARLIAYSAGFSERLPETGEAPRRIITSTDARAWTALSPSASFWDRGFSAHVALNGNLYFLGAYVASGIGQVGEVWSIRDGREVTRITDRPAFGKRGSMSGAAKDGRLWVYGGYVEEPDSPPRAMDDLWSSGDGIAWTRITDSALGLPSYGRTMLTHRGGLCLIGGYNPDAEKESRDIWRSPDGVRWTRDPALLPDLEGFPFKKILTFRDRIWMIAVYHDRDNVPRAGIWAAP